MQFTLNQSNRNLNLTNPSQKELVAINDQRDEIKKIIERRHSAAIREALRPNQAVQVTTHNFANLSPNIKDIVAKIDNKYARGLGG